MPDPPLPQPASLGPRWLRSGAVRRPRCNEAARRSPALALDLPPARPSFPEPACSLGASNESYGLAPGPCGAADAALCLRFSLRSMRKVGEETAWPKALEGEGI